MELTLDLDEEVYDSLEKRANRHDFTSPEDYAAAIVTTVLEELECDDPEEVRDRLEDLGYL